LKRISFLQRDRSAIFYIGFENQVWEIPTASKPLKIGDGSEENRVAIYLTTKSLLETVIKIRGGDLSKPLLLHVDGTYKLNLNEFPIVAIGVSDIRGKFFPVSMAIMSNRESSDYIHLFSSLCLKIKEILGIDLRPDFIMSDAEGAVWIAAEKVFPHSHKLMCYFHVVYDCRKFLLGNLRTVMNAENKMEKVQEILSQIRCLYKCSNAIEFCSNLAKFSAIWKACQEFDRSFTNYFSDQWINSRFCKWQLFHRPVGYSATNNPLERCESNFEYNLVLTRDLERVS
jgi:hypothetical protein